MRMEASFDLVDLAARTSGVDHFFRTNELPSELDATEIRRILALAEKEVVALGTESDGREALEALIAKCKASLSPIRQVPPEVISDIFAMCVPCHVDDDQHWSTVDITSLQWSLSHVSSSWRAVAIAQPSLWAHIKIDLEEIAQAEKPEPPLVMLETSLERSRSLPLRVFFNDSFKPTDRAQEMLSSLMSHSHRWNQASFFISFSHLYLTNQVRNRLPLLQYLNICAYGASTFPAYDGFEIAPALRDVYINDTWADLTLPWAQLTRLGGEIIVSPGEVIRRCPQLLHCHFTFPDDPFSRIFAPITRHQQMQRLEMNVVGVLQDMILPSLQELCITNRMSSPMDLRTFAEFFHRCGSSLRVFIWKDATITEPSIFKTALENIPNLVRLEIGLPFKDEMWNINTNLIEPLIVTQSSRVLPKLESVMFDINQPDYLIGQSVIATFLDMVESRWFESSQQDVTRLREAKMMKLRIREYDAGPVRVRIQTLLDQGLEIAQL